ncbi:MAG: hypothetical protein KKE35_06790 [Actinobacteria bacterium]|nr:hypothetical protein [Actinomycetota bacterium]
MKNFIKKSTILIIALIFILGLIPALSSCTPKLSFENIVISEDVKKDTNEPINPKNEFDISAKQIFATVKYIGTKGSDNWQFKWTLLESGEIVLDKGEKFNKDEPNTIFEGIASSNIYTIDDKKIIPAGNYKVEFFNNGELINTANFKVNKPQMEIIEVKLANAVDNSGVPVKETQQFSPSETVYATVKLNYQVTGNSFKALWKDSAGKVINEINYDIPGDYYEGPSYIWFMLQLTGGQTPTVSPGKYKVEIYLNDSLSGTYDFEVMEGSLVTFNQGTVFTNADFAFSIAIPDDWTYTEIAKNEVGFSLAPPTDISGNPVYPVTFFFTAAVPAPYKPYKDFSEKSSEDAAKQQAWTYVESLENDLVLKNGTSYKEYMYKYTDKDGGNFIFIYSFIENKSSLYLFIAIASDDISGDVAQAVYYGMLDTLTFK